MTVRRPDGDEGATQVLVRTLMSRGRVVGAALATAVVVFAVGSRRVGEPAALAMAVGVPLLLLGAWWAFRRARHEERDRRAIRAASLGTPGRRPGTWGAAVGRASAIEEPTMSPLSGAVVLACHYEVREKARRRGAGGRAPRRRTGLVDRSGSRRYEGFRLVPIAVGDGEDSVPLRGFLDLTFRQPCPVSTGTDLAVEELAQPAPTGVPRFMALARLLGAARDRMQVDWKHRDLVHPSEMNRFEYRLEPGEPVCVCGSWEDGGLVPAVDRPGGLPTYIGMPEKVERELAESVKTNQVMAAVALGTALALFAGGLLLPSIL